VGTLIQQDDRMMDEGSIKRGKMSSYDEAM
jgi:hypothetical protein